MPILTLQVIVKGYKVCVQKILTIWITVEHQRFHKGNNFGAEVNTDAEHGTESNSLTDSQADILPFEKTLLCSSFCL